MHCLLQRIWPTLKPYVADSEFCAVTIRACSHAQTSEAPVSHQELRQPAMLAYSGPEKALCSPDQPILGQPLGSVEYFGKTYRPVQAIPLQLRSHIPYSLQ